MEGFFTKVFRSGLQPVEVGRRILREMEEGRTISVNRIYAPNDFRIFMGPDDYSRFQQMEAGLAREFSELVIDQAKTNRWNLMGMPRIVFVEDERKGKGEFKVEASLAADAGSSSGGAGRVSTRRPPEDDPASTRAIAVEEAGRLGLAAAPAALEVLDDSGRPQERISITREPITIGRVSNNDVVLSDPNVSRRHAALKRNGSEWLLVDLGSTNGTMVNGRPGHEHRLKDGDRLGFGTSELVFRITGSD